MRSPKSRSDGALSIQLKRSGSTCLIASAFLFLATGCASVNKSLASTTQVVEYYRIFQVQSNAPKSRVIAAARDGIKRNAENIQDSTPIPRSAELPEQPGRFKPVNLLGAGQGGQMAALLGAQSAMLKSASCDGAVWLANATRSIGKDRARLSFCLWQYKQGYHLDVYSTYTVKKGGLGPDQLARKMVGSVLGSFEQAIEKLVNDMTREIRDDAPATVVFVEGYPEPVGEPWWSRRN